MTFEEVLSAFGTPARGRNTVKIKCPCHDDKTESLSISKGNDGRTVIKCFAGCNTEDIIHAVGLNLRDLFDDNGTPERSERPRWISYIEKRVQDQKKDASYRYIVHYDYHDQTGKYAFTNIRFANASGDKTFLQGVISDGGRIDLQTKNVRKTATAFFPSAKIVSDAVAGGKPVFFVEGEKDAITMKKQGYTDTVTTGSASSWQPRFAKVFAGADVVILRDNDEPGRAFADKIAKSILPVANSVRVINPCTEIKKGDVTDFFDNGRTREELDQLIGSAQVIEKPTVQTSDDPGARDADFFASGDYEKFHKFRNEEPIGVYDDAIMTDVLCDRPMFVLSGIKLPYVYRHGVYETETADADLMTAIKKRIAPSVRSAPILKRIYDLCIYDFDLRKTLDQVNNYPKHFINFQNGFFDCETRTMIPHDPKYFAINQIPHTFDPDAHPAGDFLEKWLTETIPDPDDREMFLQYCGYCMTTETRYQKFMILFGDGGTGKSTMINLLKCVIGSENTSNVELQKLNERFAISNLMGKLLNACADLNTKDVEDLSAIKLITGDDPVNIEKKGRDAINGYKLYTKLIFSLNHLPNIREERTNGFYRRPLILKVDRVPDKIDTRLFDKLTTEIDYFIHLCVDAFSRLHASGVIAESQNSIDAVNQLRIDSDVVEAWLQSGRIIRDKSCRIERGTAYDDFLQFCEEEERTPLQKKGFYSALREKHIGDLKSNSRYFLTGIGVAPADGDFGIEE